MPNELRLAIVGASGRLGRSIATLADQDPRFTLAALFTHTHSSHLGETYKPLDATPADLYIDVSLPADFHTRLSTLLQMKKPIVIGTTGLSPANHRLIEEASRQIPILYTPNFSLGMTLLRHLAKETARLFHPDATLSITETHHTQKKDAPSGSALLLAHDLKAKQPRIESIRLGQTPGIHHLSFNTAEEQIELSHTAHSREAFARGALAAAAFLSRQPADLYCMESLLESI